MALQFKEIRDQLARNIRLSICFEDGRYDNYLILSDIPDEKYNDMYVYGVGKIDVEFSKDVYTDPSAEPSGKDIDLCPALEIVLHDRPRDDVPERCSKGALTFGDLRNYLQITGRYAIVTRNDWALRSFDDMSDITEKYDGLFVYGIGLEDDPDADERFKNREHETTFVKRMVIVLSDVLRGC